MKPGDHPRVCGEHASTARPARVFEGSSPRMRGAHININPTVTMHRIIPAYAGSTRAGARHGGSTGDHPRVCGEHGEMIMGFTCLWGSSPRMRGAHLKILAIPTI